MRKRLVLNVGNVESDVPEAHVIRGEELSGSGLHNTAVQYAMMQRTGLIHPP